MSQGHPHNFSPYQNNGYPQQNNSYGYHGASVNHPSTQGGHSGYPQYGLPPPAPTYHWVPSAFEAYHMDIWFRELDTQMRGLVGGVDIALFLKKTGIAREILREIWKVVDTSNTGTIDRKQFTTLIRLISMACSPMCAGGIIPTMDQYHATVHFTVPLPPSLLMSATTGYETGAAAALSQGYSVSVSSLNVAMHSQMIPPLQNSPYVQSAVAPNHPIGNNDEDEFTEFMAGTLNNNPPLHSSVASNTAVAGIDDDDDFGPMSSATSFQFAASGENTSSCAVSGTSLAPSHSEIVTSQQHKQQQQPVLYDNSDLLFSHTISQSVALSERPIVSSSSSSSTRIGVVMADDDEDFGEMHNATSIVAPSVDIGGHNTPVIEVARTNNIFRVNDVSDANKMSAFDDLVELDMKAAIAESEDDWVEFSAAASQPEIEQTLTGAINDGNGHRNSIASSEMAAIQSHAVSDQIVGFGDDNDDGFDDFQIGSVSAINPVDSTHSRGESHILAHNLAHINISDGDNEDFADFGDFESHNTPLDANVSSQHSGKANANATSDNTTNFHVSDSLIDFLADGDELLPVTGGTSQNPITASFSNVVGAPRSDASSSSSSSLLNLLSDNDFGASYSSSSSWPAGPIAPSSSSLNLLDDDFYFTGPNTRGSVESGDIADSSSWAIHHATSSAAAAVLGADDDEFGDFTEANDAPVPVVTAAAAAAAITISRVQQSAGNPVTAVSLTGNQDKSYVAKATLKPLDIKELERICGVLSDKNMYEESYICARHISRLRTVNEVAEKKQKAMEKDDLELVTKLKKELAWLQSHLEESQQEHVWLEQSKTSRASQSIHEIAEVIQLLDPSIYSKFENRYLKNIPSKTAPILNRMEFLVRAKRSARMIIAVMSTHQQHPSTWAKIIKHCGIKIADAKNRIASFKQLSALDKAAVLNHRNMQDYVAAMRCVVEVCKLACACSVEAMQHEESAEQAYMHCAAFLKAMDECWGGIQAPPDNVVERTIDEEVLATGLVAEMKGVVYCNLTLRPVAYQLYESGARDNAAPANRHYRVLYPYTTHESKTYNQCALNLWMHDISSKLPASDGQFS